MSDSGQPVVTDASAHIGQDAEATVLAALSASLQDQDEYEDQVIRDATYAAAPTLVTGSGFPSLQDLASAPTLNVIYKVLAHVRREQQTTPGNSILYLQEQMLLSYLGEQGVRELPIRRNEARLEHERSAALAEEPEPIAVETSEERKPREKRPRVSMMQRKKGPPPLVAANSEGKEDDEAIAEHRENLRQLRKERLDRREKRRLQLRNLDGESSDEEVEARFESETEKEADVCNKEGIGAIGGDVENIAVKEEDIGNENPDDQIGVVHCPLCGDRLVLKELSERDAELSIHMDQCQSRRRSTRRTSVKSLAVTKNITTQAPPSRKRKRAAPVLPTHSDAKDDWEEWVYTDRVDEWIEDGLSRMRVMKERDASAPLPGAHTYEGGLYIPAWINDRLFGYQRESLQWMWNLHQQQAGGIMGDEMGLGKTVQVGAYLGALASSRKLRSVLIVAPATMLQHWLNELAIWAPGLRRLLIHPSGDSNGISRVVSPKLLRQLHKWLKRCRADRVNEAIDEQDWETMGNHSFCGTGYVLITTYENLRRNIETYSTHPWSYVVLDEAHKIRNPDADITLACKKIRTPHRLAMSGTPIQNDLRELWSLFDFVFPGRLGTLPAFEAEFADPIKKGGYSNASPMVVQLAYRCALMLRDIVNPFLLRRQKKEVKEVSRMPGKTEHVLFCRLSRLQRSMYEAYIKSDEVSRVLRGGNQLLAAVTVCRKICNHPDLVCDPDKASINAFLRTGQVNKSVADDSDLDSESGIEDESLMDRSGKLEVLSKILPLWNKQGHRVLIFCQWRMMLDLIQRFMMIKNWKFGRLDGNTNISSRQKLVDQFNSDESFFALLCTTRTGGVGLNLTGANRIILYDPDFNPSTDAQARERAWRFGQEKEVTIYRLICAGTIEEKIYQRQIFKTALSNKILQDPKQRRLFSQRDLHDLFSLSADTGSVRAGGDGLTQTGKVTQGVGVVDFDRDVGKNEEGDDGDDNDRTLQKVMKSKGLAGVFDHHYLEEDPSRKSTTVLEMEEHAKRVARDAAKALEKSMMSHDRYAPTWTGSEETAPRFGSSARKVIGNSSSAPPHTLVDQGQSSRDILKSLRQRNEDVASGGRSAPLTDETKQYADLLTKVKDFVHRRKPTTDDIITEFDSIPEADVAILRRLLKTVAALKGGRWHLK